MFQPAPLVPSRTDYYVDVLDDSSIYGFAASHTLALEILEFIEGNGFGSNPVGLFLGGIASTDRVGWTAATITQADWDAGYRVLSSMGGGVDFYTDDVGSFASFFGEDEGASIFWLNSAAGTPIDESSDTEEALWGAVPAEFHYSAAPNTQFLAFSQNGAVVSATAVPECSSFTFLGLIGLLVGIARKYIRR